MIPRILVALAMVAAPSDAETLRPPIRARAPLVWRSGPTAAPYPRRLQNRLLVGVGVGAGTIHNLDQQVRFYALDTLTAGGRIRVSDARVVYEAEVGYAFDRDVLYAFGSRARIDYIVLGGLGLQRDITRLPFVGSAVRVHPQSASKSTNMVAVELGVRGTYVLGASADIEVTLGVSVVLPVF